MRRNQQQQQQKQESLSDTTALQQSWGRPQTCERFSLHYSIQRHDLCCLSASKGEGSERLPRVFLPDMMVTAAAAKLPV